MKRKRIHESELEEEWKMNHLQQAIIEELGVKSVIDPQNEIRVSIDFMKE